MPSTVIDLRASLSGWFDQQADSCAQLGSPIYSRLLPHLAQDVREGRYDDLLAPMDRWRFGDALPDPHPTRAAWPTPWRSRPRPRPIQRC